MLLYIASLNSGSNGNCYYIGNEQEAVLIDAGLSCRETEKRMRRMGLSLDKVKAVFISHEHSDHIKGVTVLSKKYQIPVYITEKTMKYGRLFVEPHLAMSFVSDAPIHIGSLSVTAFIKKHDAIEPHSFIVKGQEKTIGVFTDLGIACDNLINYFSKCHVAFLEANYDVQMLEQGRYPWHLKNRIRGGFGHLSNTQALEVFRQHRPAYMSHLFLSHLSKDNNCPDKALSLFNEYADGTEVIVASRYTESRVYRIPDATTDRIAQAPHRAFSIQASLF
ncbi:MAG: MBL fold metallo-hydrolase [Sphingobacteriales bacterium]|nr:MAG: MBL fold metallo-hydrolase [Sphingobacteriales bacterium]